MDKKLICGVDEAGRGPLAGPVTAAAVILGPDFPVDILNDSKKMSAGKRESAARIIKEKALFHATGWVWPEEIDKLNIHRASLLAMSRAMHGALPQPDLILVDGKFPPFSKIECRAVIKGDSLIHEIMAASILAKTDRDKWMERYSWIEPLYKFEKHKGYPTKEHRKIIIDHGYTAIHRRSFRVSL